MNQQPIEKRNIRQDGHLEIHSIFYTIQGEGPFCGTPAVFVRLAGCNLKCPGCDTDYTSKREWMSPEAILEQVGISIMDEVGDLPDRAFVVITGGEPFRQNLGPLFQILTKHGFYVQVETNGTLAPPPYMEGETWAYSKDFNNREGVYIVCSPKIGRIHEVIRDVACCFKYVMSHDSVDESDGLPTKVLDHTVAGRVARPHAGLPVYLQPMDHGSVFTVANGFSDHAVEVPSPENKLSLEAVKQSCLKYGYILQLQIHKLIGVE